MTAFHIAILTAALGSACGGSRPPTRGASSSHAVVEAVYDCAGGSIVVYGDRYGPSLLDERRHEVVLNRWSSSDTDHFVVLTRNQDDRRPVAIEYRVPRDRGGAATMLTYDGDGGEVFKIAVTGGVWRVFGESSSTSPCAARAAGSTPLARP
jgi:hypothetical protein